LDLGAVFSQADAGTDPHAIRQWAIDAEQAGFQHLIAYDHILGATPERLGPGPFGGFPNAPYTDQHTFHEILTLFSHLAAVTSKIRLVTSVLVLPQRQAALAAKQLATVDLLSGSRLDVAVGTGWNHAEYSGLGVDFHERTSILEEQMTVMRRLWGEPLVDFDGRYHTLHGVGINPRPAVPLPLWMGTGGSDPVLRRVVRCADGWMPLLAPGLDKISVRDATIRLRQLCEEAGRDPATMPVHGRVYLPAPGWQQGLADLVELGCTRISVGFARHMEPAVSHAGQLDRVIGSLDEIRKLVGT
jgi:probable F420-dependent oxidoreductase